MVTLWVYVHLVVKTLILFKENTMTLKPLLVKPLCAVYDKKTGLFDPPMITRHVGEVIREIQLLYKNKETKFGKNPEDFDLYQIGTFNEETGEITMQTPHVHLASGLT